MSVSPPLSDSRRSGGDDDRSKEDATFPKAAAKDERGRAALLACMEACVALDLLATVLLLATMAMATSTTSTTTRLALLAVMPVHKLLLVASGCMSAYKGVAVDGSLFFALHHVVTHIYLYASTCCCCCCCCCCYDADASLPKLLPAARNYLQLALYLLMRLSKRRYDTRRQLRDCAPPRITWTEAYGGYTYAQSTVALVCVCLDPLWLRPIDMIGMAAVLDSLYTCRKNGIGAQMVGERLFPAPVAALCAQRASNGAWWRVLSVADAASRWRCSRLRATGSPSRPLSARLQSSTASSKGRRRFGRSPARSGTSTRAAAAAAAVGSRPPTWPCSPLSSASVPMRP